MEEKLDELLREAMGGKGKSLSPDARFTISCGVDGSRTGSVAIFEGSREEWRAWRDCASSLQYTDEDFRKIMDGRRDEVEAENVFANYYDRFVRRNRQARESLMKSLREGA